MECTVFYSFKKFFVERRLILPRIYCGTYSSVCHVWLECVEIYNRSACGVNKYFAVSYQTQFPTAYQMVCRMSPCFCEWGMQRDRVASLQKFFERYIFPAYAGFLFRRIGN